MVLIFELCGGLATVKRLKQRIIAPTVEIGGNLIN
jgi:hypothetical protein